MDKELDKLTKRNLIYETALKCPFCGGTMLPLEYCVDGHGNWTDRASLFNQSGALKACSTCGIVRFYADEEME